MREGVLLAETKEAIATTDTLGQAFLQSYRRYGASKVAMRHKRFGIWNPYTWADSYEQVKNFALGMVALGLGRGDKVAMLGDTEPELYWGMFAFWCVGAVSVGVHVDALRSEVEYVIGHSDATFVLARDQEQVDKLLAIKDRLTGVKKVIWWDQRGMRNYLDPWLLSFQQVSAMGKAYDEAHPHAFEDGINETQPDDPANIFYTSGTTGVPKGCCHQHRTIIAYVNLVAGSLGAGPDDDSLASFSIGSMGEPPLGSVAHLLTGLRLNIAEKPETLMADLRQVAPTYVMWMPGQWESIASTIQINVGEADFLKRFAYNMALRVGYHHAELRQQGRRPNLLWRALHLAAEQLVLRPVRDRVGLSRLKTGLSSGYTMAVETVKLLRALGIDLRQCYGSSEQGITIGHIKANIRLDCSGVPLPGCTVKLSSDGELLVKSPGQFVGYYKDAAGTEAVVRDGWLHTGDAAYIDEDNNVLVLDRLSQMAELANGAKYAPQYAEAQLRFSPYIRYALALGDRRRDYVTALITLDFQAAAKLAEKRHIQYTTSVDLSQKDEVAKLVFGEIQRVNRTLPNAARIRAFVVLHKEFDADEGELTRTRKVVRKLVESRYADLIEALYDGLPEVQVRAQVVYQDGRKGTTTALVKVRTVPEQE